MYIYSGPSAASGNDWKVKMSDHLSAEQFAQCVVGRSTNTELQHIRECPECSAALDHFDETISLFRSAVRERIDARVALQGSNVPAFSIRPVREGGIARWRWALVAAAVMVLAMLPFLGSRKDLPYHAAETTPIDADPDALMRAVNFHVSRTLPASMEPIMSLLPNDQSTVQSGGVQ